MSGPDSVLTASPPTFDVAAAQRIAADVFGVVGRASELRSERDQNFRIGDGWVLKLSNAGEAADVLAMENAGMAHVVAVDPGLPVPALRSTEDGETIALVDGHLARMVELMPGELVAAADLADAQLRDFGRTSAVSVVPCAGSSTRRPVG